MSKDNLQGFLASTKKIGERLLCEKEIFKKEMWISGLEDKVDKLNFKLGDLIYIQFNQRLNESVFHNCGHIFYDDAIFGKILGIGKTINYLKDESKNKKLICGTEEYSDAMRIWTRDPEFEHRIKALYDPEYARYYGFDNYSTKDGTRLLIAGISLSPINTGTTVVGSVDHFPKLEYENSDEQLLIHTNYLKAVNADVFLNEDIPKGIEKYNRDMYKPIISKFKEKFDSHTNI